MKGRPAETRDPIRLLSVIVPTRNEEGAITSTVEHLYVELRLHGIEHEIVVVDDGSTDTTWQVLCGLRSRIPTLNPVHNAGENGYGRAVSIGFDQAHGDGLVVMMADESDDCRDVVRYWELLNQGWDAVFGSRFMRGGAVIDYPLHKLVLNRLANWFIRITFNVSFTDFTNAFKAYRREALDGCRPLLSPHFNLNIELPLKIGFSEFAPFALPCVIDQDIYRNSHFFCFVIYFSSGIFVEQVFRQGCYFYIILLLQFISYLL